MTPAPDLIARLGRRRRAVLAAERPQLVVTNLMVASAMLNCLGAVTEQGSISYSEVYLDVIHNAARSRSPAK